MTKEAALPDETEHTVDEISGAVKSSVEIGESAEPDLYDIERIVSEENINKYFER